MRATVNAWLEEISFRTGIITGAVALLLVAAAGAALAVLGHGGQAASALGARDTANPAAVAPSALPSAGGVSRSRTTPGSATTAPARSAASSGPPSAMPGAGSGSGTAGSAPAAAVAGPPRAGYGPGSPAWPGHGLSPGWAPRRWIWGTPYGGVPRFRGSWW